MAIQSSAASAPFGQNRVGVVPRKHIRPKARIIVAHLPLAICGCLIVNLMFGIAVARTGTPPTISTPLPQFLPGQSLPIGLRCGAVGYGSCYANIYTQWCYKLVDASCFTSASIQQDGKTLFFIVDMASRTIALTKIPAHDYTFGDLLLAWGTPTGFSQSNRDISVYWGTRMASSTTCSFLPESRVDFIIYHPEPPIAARWRGFVSINSKDCREGIYIGR